MMIRSHRKGLNLVLCGMFCSAFLMIGHQTVHAFYGNNANAVDALGQYNEVSLSAPDPVYTKSSTQNGPNRLGFSAPTLGLVADTTYHRLFISDTGNNRILVYNLDPADNTLLDRIPDYVIGQANFYSATSSTSQAGLNAPQGIAFDAVQNRLFVGNANRVLVYDLRKGITNGMNAYHLIGQAGYTTATAGNTQTGLNVVQGLYYNTSTKQLFVAQSGSNRVTVFTLSNGIASALPADDLLGQYDETNFTDPVPIYTKTTAGNGANRVGLSTPRTLALDTVHHRLFLSDMGHVRILVYNLDASNNLLDRVPDYVIGQADFYTNIASITQSSMQGPRGLAYDPDNDRLFIAESTNHRVMVFSTATITNGMAASYVIGQTLFSTSTAATTQAGMNTPQDVYYDRARERLFVSQSVSNRVTVYDLRNGISNGMNASSVLGQANFTTATAASTQAGMNVPVGLTYDEARQYLFVSQTTGNRVTVYDVASITDGENAINVLGQSTFTTSTAATTQTGMNVPHGIAYDAARNYLFVAQSTGNRVTVYDVASITNGENAINVLGQSTFTGTSAGTTQSTMAATQAVLYDGGNTRLYVSESTNNRVLSFDVATITDGENAADVLGQGDDNLTDPGPVFTKGAANDVPNKLGFSGPSIGLAVDTTLNRLYMTDSTNNRILIYNLTTTGALVDHVPDYVIGQPNFYSSSSNNTQDGLITPTGLTIGNGKLFVVSTGANRVTVYDVASITNGENAINVLGQSTFTATTAATTQAGMNNPFDITYDAARNYLFVSQGSGNRVTVYDVASITNGENAINVLGQSTFTTSTAATTQAGMNTPFGLAYDSAHSYLFVGQGTLNNRVTVYDVASITDGENAINVLGQSTFTATAAATTQAGMNNPRGLAYDAASSLLFVVQQTINRVTAFDLSAGITNGMSASIVLGQINFTTATAANTQAGMSGPIGVAYDGVNKKLYVSQVTNNRISIFDMVNGFSDTLPASSVLGQATFTSTTAATTQAGMNVPYDVTMSGSSTLFVSQGTGNRVTVYNLADGITDGENAIKVLGQSTFTATAVGNTQTGMNAPRGITYDPSGKRLFVTQTTGNRVTVYNLADGITDGESAMNVLGQSLFTVITAGVTQTGMSGPQGVSLDTGNNFLYVLQNGSNRATVYDIGSITDGENAIDALGQSDDNTMSPGALYTTSVANNGPNIWGMSGPQGVSIDMLNHRLFVADATNNRVTVYNLNTDNTLTDHVADYVLGQADFHSAAAVTTQASLRSPQSIDYDEATGWLFVADATNNRVLVFDLSGGITNGMNATYVLGQTGGFTVATAATTQSGMSGPQRVRYNATLQKLFVADTTNNRVLVFDLSGGITNGMNATDVLGQYDDSLSDPQPVYTKSAANNGPNAGFSAPTIGLYLDTTYHRLFLGDSGNNRVLVYNLDASNALLDRIPDYVIGQSNLYSNTAASTQAGLNAPQGIAFDSVNNRLFVASTNRILTYDLSNGITNGMSAFRLLGQSSYTTVTAGNTQTGLNVPQSLYYDTATKQLFVAESTGNRVKVFDLSAGTGNNPNATDALGQYDETDLSAPLPVYTKGSAHNAPNRLGYSSPQGLALDAVHHRLFVADSGSNRVLVYTLDSGNALADNIPDYVIGQSDFDSSSAATSQSALSGPRGLSYDSANDLLFVADSSNNRVMVFSTATLSNGMNARFVLGQANFSLATLGVTQAIISSPQDVVYDSANSRLFVVSGTHNRILVYDVSSISNGENAINVLGQGTFTASTQATTQSGLNLPTNLAYDAARQYLFVSQSLGNRVTVFDVTNITDGESAINVLGQANFTATSPASTQAGMNVPSGLAYNATQKYLYVAQSTGARVTIYDLNSIADGENAINVLGQSNFTNSAASLSQTGMNSPQAVLSDDTNSRLYVSDALYSRVLLFSISSLSNGEPADSSMGQYNDSLTAPAGVFDKGTDYDAPNKLGMNGPQIGIALDLTTNNRLYVSDTSNNRVLVYNLSTTGALLDRIPDYVLGQPHFSINSSNYSQSFLTPTGLEVNGNTLFVSDTGHNRVLVFDVTTIANGESPTNVLGQPDISSSSSATTQSGLSSPYGLAYAAGTQYLYVAALGSNRVVVYDVASITDGENAINVLGQSTFTASTAATTQAGMNAPYGVAYDSADSYLFVAQSTGNRVTVYDVASIADGENAINVLGQATFTTSTVGNTQTGMNAPRGITYDTTSSTLFVAQTTGNRVTLYDLSGGITDGQGAAYVFGQTLFTTLTANTTQTGMSGPSGLAYDAGHKRLYVSQSGTNRVTMYDLNTNFSDNLAASHVLGQAAFTTATAATTQAGMNVPYGLAYDSTAKYLFVSQGTGNRVTVYDISAGVTDGQNAYRVLGQADFTTTTAANTQAGLNAPRGITYDNTADKLYVAQTTGNRVSVFDLSGGITNGQGAANVLGQSLFTTITAATTQAGLSAPQGVVIDEGNSRLYVLQNGNNRASIFDVASITDGENAADLLGQYDDDLTSPLYTTGGANNGPNTIGMSGPQGIAVDDAYHRFFVSDSANNRILVYNLDTNNAFIDHIPDLVIGQADFHSNAAATTQTGLSAPQGVSYDKIGNRLFVSDSTNNRVLSYYMAQPADGMAATGILGQATFTAATALITQAATRAPQSVFYGPQEKRLYVAESTNNRITIFDADIRGITGKIYTDNGRTPIAAGKKVAVSLNGAPFAATGVTIAGGQYSITGTGGGLAMTGGTVVAVYLDNNGERGVTVTTGSGKSTYDLTSSMTGVDIYQDTLIARTDSGSQVMNNSKLTAGTSNGFADVGTIYTVDNGTLNVKAGKNLIVWSGSTFTPGGNVRIGSGLTIRGILNAGSNTIALSGSFLKEPYGTFNAGTSTVELDGLLQSVSGSTTFYNLTKTGSVTDTLTFAAGTTQTITNKLSLNGMGGGLLWLRSEISGTQWKINPSAVRAVSYLDVKDSNNINATAIDCLTGCVDSLNNINWNFAGGGSSSSASSTENSNQFFFFGF